MREPTWRSRWWMFAPLLLALAALSLDSLGQPPAPAQQVSPRLRPVIAQSQRDGLLLGLDFNLSIGDWQLGVGGAYGFISQAGRFRTRVQYLKTVELSYGDWPTSLVLGRQGEQGIHASLDLIALSRLLARAPEGLPAALLEQSRLQGTGFLGRLWPGQNESQGPEVAYAHLSGFIHWPLPYGLAFEARGELLLGQPLEDSARLFQTFFSSSRLWVDQTILEFQLGELNNPAGLQGFRFDLGLRSYPGALAGNRFLLASLEQRFALIPPQVTPLDLTSLLGPILGWIPIQLRVTSSVFFEAGMVFGEGQGDSREVLFGWGTSLIFPDFDLKVDLAINREGVPVFTVEAGLLP